MKDENKLYTSVTACFWYAELKSFINAQENCTANNNDN